jgi:transformation/transcription domain-associated protein
MCIASSVLSSANWQPRSQKEFHEDFLTEPLTHYDYVRKLQKWRDRYEAMLDSRPRLQPLALLSHYLIEFHYNKVDEIEVPGQYTEVCSS